MTISKVVPRLVPTTYEIKYPFIVELAVEDHQLDVELSRRIMGFHASRHIRPRYGRSSVGRGGKNIFHYRWCFPDLLTARNFVEEFGGEFCKPTI